MRDFTLTGFQRRKYLHVYIHTHQPTHAHTHVHTHTPNTLIHAYKHTYSYIHSSNMRYTYLLTYVIQTQQHISSKISNIIFSLPFLFVFSLFLLFFLNSMSPQSQLTNCSLPPSQSLGIISFSCPFPVITSLFISPSVLHKPWNSGWYFSNRLCLLQLTWPQLRRLQQKIWKYFSQKIESKD